MIFSTNCNSNAIIKTSLDSSAVGVRMTGCELQSLRVETFAVCGGKALAADGIEMSLSAVTGVLVEAVSRIKFF